MITINDATSVVNLLLNLICKIQLATTQFILYKFLQIYLSNNTLETTFKFFVRQYALGSSIMIFDDIKINMDAQTHTCAKLYISI